MPEITREELIALCEAAIVPEERWHDRDSADAQRQIGEAWALLRAGCQFSIHRDTNSETIVIAVEFKGFWWFEVDKAETETFYIPTRARLDRAAGGDWY